MKLSLRIVRVCFGYTVEEVAEYCGVSVKSLEAYEMDSGKMPINTALKVKKLYATPLDSIFIGPESECFKYNRDAARAQTAAREAK